MLVLVYSASNSTSCKAASDIIPVEKPSQAESFLELHDTNSAHLRGPRLRNRLSGTHSDGRVEDQWPAAHHSRSGSNRTTRALLHCTLHNLEDRYFATRQEARQLAQDERAALARL